MSEYDLTRDTMLNCKIHYPRSDQKLAKHFPFPMLHSLPYGFSVSLPLSQERISNGTIVADTADLGISRPAELQNY